MSIVNESMNEVMNESSNEVNKESNNDSMNHPMNESHNSTANPDANILENASVSAAINAVDNLNNDLLAEATALKNSLENVTATTANAEASAIATVRGEAFTALPLDLYIPPDAMEVILEIFEGPLDLLLYLIRKHNLDILDIPVAEITRQYTEYVDLMTQFRLELAADYLEMAALLAEIKSRMLLPRPPELGDEEQDPRAELVRRLQEYERIKVAAEQLEQMPRLGRDFFTVSATPPKFDLDKPQPYVDLKEILLAFKDVLKRVDHKAMHEVQREGLSVRERMSRILSSLAGDKFIDFVDFFDLSEGRLGVVVTFLAILELLRETMIELVQTEAYGPIYVRAPGC